MKSIKSKLKSAFTQITGYSVFNRDYLPIGCDLATDIRHKIRMQVKVIFDVGANVGQMAMRFNSDFPLANIYSFEPVLETYNKLNANVKHINKIQCHHLALGERNGQLEIKTFTGRNSVLNSLNPESMNMEGKSEIIQINNGDQFCVENKIEYIDLLKIDTEGFEVQVLKGFSGMMGNSKIGSVFCEVGFRKSNKRNTYINDVFDFLGEHGFEFYGLYDMYNKHLVKGSDFGSVFFVKAVKLNETSK